MIIFEIYTLGNCDLAPPGTYGTEGVNDCLTCATSTITGSTKCDCTLPGYCEVDGACNSVPDNYYSPAGITQCLMCPDLDKGNTNSTCDCSDAGQCLITGKLVVTFFLRMKYECKFFNI